VRKLFINSFETEWGVFRTAATNTHLVLISLPGESGESFNDRIAELYDGWEFAKGGAINEQAKQEIKSYISGKLKKFSVKFEIHASPFQKKVLLEVARIPFGKTRSYGEIAATVGNPRASRAVGTANARNNLPLVIPCHRVVASNGIGGYGGGLSVKRKLLRHEGIEF
jgi:methylated-DNA-[protein]-cysteine S-methyltransferase